MTAEKAVFDWTTSANVLNLFEKKPSQVTIAKDGKTVAEIDGDGNVKIDWKGVEAMAYEQNMEMATVICRLLIAVRDKSYRGTGGIDG